MFRSFRFLRLQAVMLCLGVLLIWPALGSAGGRKDSPKGSYGSGDEVFDSAPVTFTLAGGSTFTLQSRVRCETFPPGDCISANSIFPYFYVVTVGPTAISQKITIKISAPFDPHNSPILSFGILDELDMDDVGTHIAACSTDACIDGVLAATSSYQNNVLTFNLDPSSLSTGQFAPGDQIWVYATSFSPPACTLDYTTTNALTCSQASSLTGTLSVSAPGTSVSPASTPGLVPVPPVPHKIVAPAETSYFNPDSVFTGNTIDAQTTQGTTTTPLSGFISSTVDLAHCNFCGANTKQCSVRIYLQPADSVYVQHLFVAGHIHGHDQRALQSGQLRVSKFWCAGN